jgi:prevent-host-death family protein
MPMIRPSSDLRNKYNEISEFCNQYQEPVFITKNGTGDLVVMTNAQYEQLCGKSELHRLLDAGLTELRAGHGRPASDVFSDLEERFGLSADV